MENESTNQEGNITQLGDVTKQKLRSFVSRIENLESEKSELAADIRDVYAEVKAFGLDTKAVRAVVKRRRTDEAELSNQDTLVELYSEAVED